MDKEIRCAYSELKNKFGTAVDVGFDKNVVHKEIVPKSSGIKMRKKSKSKSKPVFKYNNSVTTESLIELQKHFNLN